MFFFSPAFGCPIVLGPFFEKIVFVPLHFLCSFVKSQLTMFQFSHSVVSDSLQPHGLKFIRTPCPSPTPGVLLNSYPLSLWCHPTISSSVPPFSSCPQSFPASGCFQMLVLHIRWTKYWGFSFSIYFLNIQDWFPLGWTSWISLLSKGLTRVFNTTVQKHQFFGSQLFL